MDMKTIITINYYYYLITIPIILFFNKKKMHPIQIILVCAVLRQIVSTCYVL